jgi:ABC-type branched-subunit amino acid transport system ATPase component
VQAVNNVILAAGARAARCLIGPNGAGKSTFFKCLTGQIRLNHTHGRVFIRGHDVTGWRAYEIVRLGVGIKTQVPSVMNGLNVEENLWLSARRVNGRESVAAVVAEVIEQMSLASIARRKVGELAHGRRWLRRSALCLRSARGCCCSTSPQQALPAPKPNNSCASSTR